MKCHQILTGAANKGDRTFGVGSVEGISFTAYAAGCNIVILSSSFERVQIIPGVCHDNIQISCLHCSIDTGKIAAAYENEVILFEPTPLQEQNSKHGLDYWWVETARLKTDSYISTLSWNNEGNRLLTAGQSIQLWHHKNVNDEAPSFEIGSSHRGGGHSSWTCLWSTKPANPVLYLSFSPDGTLFATAGKTDRLVRIWYQNQQLLFPSGQTKESVRTAACSDSISFSYIYLAHPRSVTGFSWRKTSKYMPRGAVGNLLVTSCLDNICRLWSETLLPEDGVVSMTQLDPNAAKDCKFRTHRQKARFIQRFRHMRQSFTARKSGTTAKAGAAGKAASSARPEPIASLPSTYSVHEFHNYGFQSTGISPGLHFHLAGTINALTDIPLVPSMAAQTGTNQTQQNFTLHWLNNKEMQFSVEAEKIMEDLFKLSLDRDDTSLELELAVPATEDIADSGSIGSPMKGGGMPPRPPNPRRGKRPIDGVVPHTASSNSLAQSDVSQSGSGGHHGSVGSGQHHSINLSDMLDHRIDRILKDWHQSSDLLFSVHPIDGSLLVWIADFLDEYQPGSFRQAQVSFSSRIPNALPLGDAMTMGGNVELFNGYNILNFKELVKDRVGDFKMDGMKEEEGNGDGGEEEDDDEEMELKIPKPVEEEPPKPLSPSEKLIPKYKPPPIVSMISKHHNGTLNLWNVMFAEKSNFSQLLNISHGARSSGHRFRVNAITCHPVLPLLLTTSHHNIVKNQEDLSGDQEVFRSELILWRVDPVGPLSKSGGITELARVNSMEISAFSDVAWIPTLLPSTTLGRISNSPSACFVASDGHSLRVYQAIIDARTLLAEINCANRRKSNIGDAMSDMSSGHSTNVGGAEDEIKLQDKFKIVSTQSSARPGAIIELEAIADATQNWQSTLMLHAFQEQLILSQGSIPSGNKGDSAAAGHFHTGLITSKMSAIVDLEQHTSGFHEPFYVLIAEKTAAAVMMHMWRLDISSQSSDQNEDGNGSSGSVTPDAAAAGRPFLAAQHSNHASEVHVSTEKVCVQRLPLPQGVEIIHAVPAVGHLSSSSIYPACLAPYVMVTACSDSKIRFWRVKMHPAELDAATSSSASADTFEWQEWQMESASGESAIEIPGTPVSVSAAYSGRLACAYQTGQSFQRMNVDPNLRYINLCVGIYECESTGGSEWILEDTISLRNIEILPEIPAMDLKIYEDGSVANRTQESLNKFANHFSDDLDGEDMRRNLKGLVSVPSLSTLDGVKKYISKMGNAPSSVSPKQSVMLDWVSNEDGSHILTVAVGNKVILLTAVSSDISQASMKAANQARGSSSGRRVLRKSASMGFQQTPDEIRWMQIRRIALRTADGLNPTPMACSWVRDGILMCGMDNEIAVFSQWRDDSYQDSGPSSAAETGTLAGPDDRGDIVEHRNLQEADILNLAQESQMRNVRSHGSFTNLTNASLKHLSDGEKRKKGCAPVCGDSAAEAELMPDFGLFEAAHIACPVLPQYHPKQLMELLNSGKIRWVKAILGHLVRCIGGGERSRTKSGSGSFAEDGSRSPRSWSRSRTLSVSMGGGSGALSPGDSGPRASVSGMPEEVHLDYTEINSIPPLPLWTLLAADKESGNKGSAAGGGGGATAGKKDDKEYDSLFGGESHEEDDNLENLLEVDDDFDGSRAKRRRRPTSEKQQGLSYFGPRQARILSKLLTHAHLPGLTSLDQMHLLALADTVASCQLDLADRFAIDAAKRQMAKETDSSASEAAASGEASPETLDDCGLRFLLAMKHYTYLNRCLPMAQRKLLQKQGLSTSYLIWGFHSESEEELLSMIPSVAKKTPNWPELRELGTAWWIRNNTTLRKLMEKVAKTAFQANQDPLDAAVFYLAMKKKNLVWGLYRSVKDEKMTAFFANNFSEDRWRKAALKNAFALLGKQRFMHAAAFFLLSGSLKDAIDICIDKLDDLQLAMVIARLYEGEINQVPDSLKALLYKHVLGRDPEGENENVEKAHPDPFVRSIGLWINKEYSQSLATLVDIDVGQLHAKYFVDDTSVLSKRKAEADPSVFNFYIYLRTHPLIGRHQIANRKDTESHAIHLSGFRNSSKDKDSTFSEDTVTPLERRLYFSTAHFHLRAGCPALAVEVLSKLPNKVIDSSEEKSASKKKSEDRIVETGTLEHSEMDWSQPVVAAAKESPKQDFVDWSAPVSARPASPGLDLDWSQPVKKDEDDELKLEWSDDPESEEEDSKLKRKGSTRNKAKTAAAPGEDDEEDEEDSAPKRGVLDIMAQQLKFIACLKIMMEELSTLATGFEVDGGLLRYQLYIWLEREVEALKQLCNYGATDANLSSSADEEPQMNMRELFASKGRRPTLHEVMMAEKADFESKVQRAVKRKQWLKANQTLLRTLLSYCGLHGANGGGLASVRMELILLLQELQQEKTQKQLLSPLPFPTTLPLLSACIAQQKTVVIDPIRHLQAMAHDMLETIVNQSSPPLPALANYSSIFLLRDLSVALSSCIYQSLCDSDSINMKKLAARDGPASAILDALSRLSVVYQDSSLISTNRKMSYDEITQISTEPSKWPGVTSLRALLDREKDEETPNLNVLLCETFVAIYMSLLSYALASCDAQILYRLISQKITPNYWSHIFGGGAKKTMRVETMSVPHPPLSKELSNETSISGSDTGEGTSQHQQQQGLGVGSVTDPSALLNTMTSITKQRIKLNVKVLGVQLGPTPEGGGPGAANAQGQNANEKSSYREQFMAPEMSIVSKFMTKPLLDAKDLEIDYDSGEESEAEDGDSDDAFEDDDPFSNVPPPAENREHSDPNSYSWCMMRYAAIRLAQNVLERFIAMAGIEIPDLPVASPLIYSSLRVTEAWLSSTLDTLNGFGCAPESYIPGCFSNQSASGPTIEKYKALFEPQNTPFPTRGHGLGPIKRLWQYLVRQTPVQKLFVKYIFGRRRRRSLTSALPPMHESGSFVSRLSAEANAAAAASNAGPDDIHLDVHGASAYGLAHHQIARMHQPVKIIHKDHDAVTAFCINKVSTGLMTIATQKELQELNIALLLNPSSWSEGMNDEADFDVLSLDEDPETMPASNYLVIQTPGDNLASISQAGTAPLPPPSATASNMSSPNSSHPPPFGPSGGSGSHPHSKAPSVGFLEFEGGFNPFDPKMKGLHFPGSVNPQFCRLVLQRSRHLLKPVKRHKIEGVRRLAAHSHLPLYVAGCQDGSIRMWEWSHAQAVQNVRPSGVFAKVNRVRFTAQGNKFGACDGDGNVSLWQASNASQPFFNMQCHSKQTSDFVYQGACSSLFCTAGFSSDGKNVALWDTLMPHKRCQVAAFNFHESGASAILHAPQHLQLITGGKRGMVSIWDLRQQRQVHFFKAHDQAIKCLALDPNEDFFVTGSVAGDIKIWSLNSYKCYYTFAEEHARHGIFKNISQGVSQVFVDQHNRLFSCGADGSMKVRQLPDRDFIVNSI